jgi:hypothetical protein
VPLGGDGLDEDVTRFLRTPTGDVQCRTSFLHQPTRDILLLAPHRVLTRSVVASRHPPPRANSPIFTVAFPSIRQRLPPAEAMAWASFFSMLTDRRRLFERLWRLGLHHPAPAIAQALEPLGHGTGRGPWLRALPLCSQRLQGRWGREACGSHTGALGRLLVRLGIGKLTKRWGGLRRLLCPAFAATASRLRPQTAAPAAALGQTTRDGLAPPPTDSCRPQGGALTIFPWHRRLKRAPCGASQCG